MIVLLSRWNEEATKGATDGGQSSFAESPNSSTTHDSSSVNHDGKSKKVNVCLGQIERLSEMLSEVVLKPGVKCQLSLKLITKEVVHHQLLKIGSEASTSNYIKNQLFSQWTT